jgi:hypothetical protein
MTGVLPLKIGRKKAYNKKSPPLLGEEGFFIAVNFP